jgi:putative salt-induced outer membrane protein YdiY
LKSGSASASVAQATGNTENTIIAGEVEVLHEGTSTETEVTARITHNEQGGEEYLRYQGAVDDRHFIWGGLYLGSDISYLKDEQAEREHEAGLGIKAGIKVDYKRFKFNVEGGPMAQYEEETGGDERFEGWGVATGEVKTRLAFCDVGAEGQGKMLLKDKDDYRLSGETWISVPVSEFLSLRAAYEAEYRSRVPSGVRKTDTLLTTALVVGF